MEQEHNLGYNPIDSKINSIQVLRGVAALVVTIYHLKEVIKEGDPFKNEIDFLFNSGPAGVNLFFVISGFIMVYITRYTSTSPRSIVKFVARRFIRIWPAYAVITLLLYFLHHRTSLDPVFLNELIRSLLFIPISPTDPPFFGYATLTVGWSLNYEIYFYLLIAISLCFSKYKWPAFFILIILTLIGIPLILREFTWKADKASDIGPAYLNMMINPIIWNFVYGVIIGLIYITPGISRIFSAIFSKQWLVLSVIVLAVWQYLSGFFGGLGPFQWGAGSAALFTAFIFYSKGKILRFPAWLVRIGNISFSVYLIHLPVQVLISFLLYKIGYPIYNSGISMFFLSLAMTLILSQLSYEYLEIRLSGYLKDRLPFVRNIKNR
jgi:exopolysaccharide production protein ExoZ